MGFVSDYILPNGGDNEHSVSEQAAGLAAIEREDGEMPTSRDYTHWHDGRLVRSTLF